MCDVVNEKSYADTAADPGYGMPGRGIGRDNLNQSQPKENKESTFRNRLEARRNRLSRQLVEVEEALRLIYSNPDAERIHEIFERTGI